jgi:hypothetical protein
MTLVYIREKKKEYIARCGRIRKTAQGLWSTGSVFPQFEEDKGAFIGGVPVGLGHITSICGKATDPTIEYAAIVLLIKNMNMNDEIIEEYPTVFCQDCQCSFTTTNSDIEFNYNMCTFCGLTQFTNIDPPQSTPGTTDNHINAHSHRKYNLRRIDLKIQEIGNSFAYRFVGIRAIISSARSKLLQYYKLVLKLPSGGDAFAGACFFAAVHEFQVSRYGRGKLPVSLATIVLFASKHNKCSTEFGTRNKVTSNRILTLVKRLILNGLCIDGIPELNRMLLWKKCIQKTIMFKSVAEIGIGLENSNYGAVVISEYISDTVGVLKGDFIEKCDGVDIDANADVHSVLEIIKKAKLKGLFTLTIRRRKSNGKRKRETRNSLKEY